MTAPWPVTLAGAAAGLALGSYAVTTALRATRLQSALSGRSHCDACGVTLGFAETVPVFSYVRRGGSCAACGARIDPLHLVGEIGGAVVVGAAAFLGDPIQTAGFAALGLTLVAIAVVDARTRRIPNAMVMLVAASGAVLALQGSAGRLAAGVATAAVVAAVLLALRWSMRRLRSQEGLGLGDVKLLAALALWLGAATPWMVALASVAGLVAMPLVRPERGRLPFAPAIAPAALVVGFLMESGLWPLAM